MRSRDDLVFPLAEYERRLDALRQRIAQRNLDAVITTTPENIRYLSGFESPGYYYFQALIVPFTDEPIMVTRRREESGVQALTWLEHRRPYEDTEDPITTVQNTLAEFHLHHKRLGYERACWFFTAVQQERLFTHCPRVTFVECSGIVEAGRVIKSEHEIAMMRQAARAAEAGMQAGIEAAHVGSMRLS